MVWQTVRMGEGAFRNNVPLTHHRGWQHRTALSRKGRGTISSHTNSRLCFKGLRRSIVDSRSGRQHIGSGIEQTSSLQTSDFNFFGDSKRVVHLYSEVSRRAFDLGMAKQKLHRTQVARPAVDQACLRAPERVRAEDIRVQSNACDPLSNEASVLPGRHGLFR